MKRSWLLLALLPFVLMAVNNCSKSPLAPETNSTDMVAEIEVVSGEIDDLHISALAGDDSGDASKKLDRAIKRLGYLINKATKPITEKGDETAQQKLADAQAALESAKELAAAQDFENGFEAVQAGVDAVKEAFSAVTGKKLLNKGQTKKFKELRKVYAKSEKLLRKTRKALKGSEDENAVKLYKRARAHLDAAKKALKQRKLRRAEWNLKEARKLSRRALKKVAPDETEP